MMRMLTTISATMMMAMAMTISNIPPLVAAKEGGGLEGQPISIIIITFLISLFYFHVQKKYLYTVS